MLIRKKIKNVGELGPGDLPDVPYYVIVSANFAALEPDELNNLAELLVNTNAMHVAACGNQGTLCDDAVDWVCVEREVLRGIERPSVATTWHDNETIEDVIDFLSFSFPFEGWDIEEWPTIVIQIG